MKKVRLILFDSLFTLPENWTYEDLKKHLEEGTEHYNIVFPYYKDNTIYSQVSYLDFKIDAETIDDFFIMHQKLGKKLVELLKPKGINLTFRSFDMRIIST